MDDRFSGELELTADEEAEAQRIEDLVMAKARVEARQLARMLASKEYREVLGPAEFAVRDACHRIGAVAVDAALEVKKKKVTTARRRSARDAESRSGS
jgi:hypothetical protein